MEILGNFFDATAYVVSIVLNMYFWVVIISALLSWVRPDPYNPIVRFLYAVTEPVYRRIRRMMPFIVVSGFDLSPIVVIIVIQFLQIFLVNTLRSLAV